MESYSVKLGDIVNCLDYKRIPISSKEREKRKGPYPYYGAQGIVDYIDNYIFDGIYMLVAEDGENLRSQNEPIAQIAKGKYWVNNHAHILESNGKCDIRFVCYYLNTLNIRGYITGSAQPKLNQDNLLSIKMILPSLKIQKELADALDVIDSKIALNTQMNTELEAMAKQLYDYWFVQFDFPDENGKPYKSSGGKMVYNPTLKREIPEGWEACTLGDFCDLYQPKTIGTDEMSKNGKYHVYGANGLIGFYDKYNHEKSEIVMACRGNSCGAINRTMPFSWITGNAMVLSVKDKSISNEFISQCTNYMNIKGAITGSGQPQLTRENLAPLLMIYPLQNILKQFSKKVTPIIEHRLHIQKTNEYLTHLRDSLLPMLMNGQVTDE